MPTPLTLHLPVPKVTHWLDLARGQDHPTWAALHALPGPLGLSRPQAVSKPPPDRTLLVCTDSFRVHAIHTGHPLLAAENVRIPPGSYHIQPTHSTGWTLTLDPDMKMPDFSAYARAFPFQPPDHNDPAPPPPALTDWPNLTRTVAKALDQTRLVALFAPQQAAGLLRFDAFVPLARLASADPDLVPVNPLFVVDALARPRPPRPSFTPAVRAQLLPRHAVRLGDWLTFSLFLQTRTPLG